LYITAAYSFSVLAPREREKISQCRQAEKKSNYKLPTGDLNNRRQESGKERKSAE
jgi:hypothetical protein